MKAILMPTPIFTPKPEFASASGVINDLAAVLDCSIDDVVEFAPADKDAEVVGLPF